MYVMDWFIWQFDIQLLKDMFYNFKYMIGQRQVCGYTKNSQTIDIMFDVYHLNVFRQ